MGELLIAQMLAGSRRARARLLTQIENDPQSTPGIIQKIYTQTGKAHIVGITGAPGSGKSTLVTELAKAFRQRAFTVAIVAVDPSSPFSGGALLGDRIRMNALSGDPGIFIRSLATRGSLGGLAVAASNVIKLFDAAGFDLILVETVGAGQAEVDVAHAAHTTIVIEAPGMGDEVQSIKAGILEIADILVVNKADKHGAESTILALKNMLHLGPIGGTRHHGRIQQTIQPEPTQRNDIWEVPVLATTATTGEGVSALAETILAHQSYLQESGLWLKREQQRAQQEMTHYIQARLLAEIEQQVTKEELSHYFTDVAQRKVDFYTAVEKILDQINLSHI